MYCYTLPTPQYFIFAEGVPHLLYYSHLPSIVIALLLGSVVLFNGPKVLLNRLLFAIAVCFSAWTFIDLIVWTNTNSDTVMFLWSFFGLLYALISVFSLYFIYVFLNKRDAPVGLKLFFVGLLLPVLAFGPTAYNLAGFNLELCGSSGFEGVGYFTYYTLIGVVSMVLILFMLLKHFVHADSTMRKEIVLMGIGIELFLFSFFVTGFLASYLNEAGILQDYSLEQYGLFGMVVFMALIAFMIVRFKAFNTGLFGAQVLVVAILILIASEFTFLTSFANRVLVSITFVLTAVAGVLLIRSVRNEIEQRQHIEQLAQDLEKANAQQVVLIHFITHQIKGFVTKSRNIFAALVEGDYGPLPESMKPLIEEGFRSDTKGAATIQQILDASNIKSGKMAYKNEPFDLKELVEEIVKDLKVAADQKNLALTVTAAEGAYTIVGDRMQMLNAIKNLIDNSVKYTPSGSVDVSLTKEEGKIRFQVKDTGVGITPEDMQVLFTEGGHGKESTKVNVDSTGFGLYIVKNIIEAHKGKVWAESEGAGKGSRFIAELPA